MPLSRYPVQLTVLEDTGSGDGRLIYVIDNNGGMWVSSNLKSGDTSASWVQLPDLPQ